MEATLPIGGGDPVAAVAIMSACVLMVALLAGSEAALLSVSKIRIRNLAEQGVKSALAVAKLVEKHDTLFATILTVENFFIIIASSLGTAIALEMFGPTMLVWASLVLTVLVVIFGEITPKTYAAQNSEKVALLVARPLLFLIRIIGPAIAILSGATRILLRLLGQKGRTHSPFVTEEELRMMIDVSSSEGVLKHEERELLQNVFEFGDTVASEVMVTRTQLEAMEDTGSLKDLLNLGAETGHSRFPVFHETVDQVIGVVHLKDALVKLASTPEAMGESITTILRPAIFIPENKRIAELLPMMQKRRLRMVVVADEFGGTEGIVTIEDLLEEIVGDLEDERHEEGEGQVQTVDERTAVVEGATSIEDVNELVQVNLPYGSYQTIAGFILTQLGHIPHVGEKLKYETLELTVTDVQGPRIEKVTIVKND